MAVYAATSVIGQKGRAARAATAAPPLPQLGSVARLPSNVLLFSCAALLVAAAATAVALVAQPRDPALVPAVADALVAPPRGALTAAAAAAGAAVAPSCCPVVLVAAAALSTMALVLSALPPRGCVLLLHRLALLLGNALHSHRTATDALAAPVVLPADPQLAVTAVLLVATDTPTGPTRASAEPIAVAVLLGAAALEFAMLLCTDMRRERMMLRPDQVLVTPMLLFGRLPLETPRRTTPPRHAAGWQRARCCTR